LCTAETFKGKRFIYAINHKLIVINQMATENKLADEVLIFLLKEPFTANIVTIIANKLDVTRQGLWKSLSKLEKENLIIIKKLAKTRTSTATISINWSNPITEKTLSLFLTKEALKQKRWQDNFAEIGKHASFLILFGSILHGPKEANDIDLLAIVKDRKEFKLIDENVLKIQRTQLKKIHLIDLTEDELFNELKSNNKVYLEAIQKGVILFGQDNFIDFMKKFAK